MACMVLEPSTFRSSKNIFFTSKTNVQGFAADLLRRLQRLWRERCTDKKTRKGVTTGDAKRTPGHTTAKDVATTPTKAKPPTKPAPPPPLLVNADDLCACLHGLSGTNDGELYPGGYITNGANSAYTMTSRQLRCYQPVLLSVNGHYQRGSVRKVDRAKGTATVRVTRLTTPPPDVAYTAEQPKVPTQGTRKRATTGTRRRTNTMKPTHEEMVVPVSALLDCTAMEWLMEKAYGVCQHKNDFEWTCIFPVQTTADGCTPR